MTYINNEIRNRIRISLASYSYEVYNDSIISDAEYDELAKKINPQQKTNNEKLDRFFSEEYVADSGMWIHKHPEKDKLDFLYKTFKKRDRNWRKDV